MFRDAGQIIVADFELTCWENDDPPEGEQREIIQMGWCLLNPETLERSGKGQIVVRPAHSRITEFCTDLTGITPKMARAGVPFPDACKTIMRKAATRRRAWASWGVGDRLAVERDCAMHECDNPFCDTHFDIQAALTLFMGYRVRMGQSNALAALGIAEDGTLHRADDDAWNGAGVLAHIIGRARDKETYAAQSA